MNRRTTDIKDTLPLIEKRILEIFGNKVKKILLFGSYAREGFDSKTHKGAIHLLNKHFIKSGLLPITISEILTESFEMRIDCDYEDFFVVSKDEAIDQIENAEILMSQIIHFIKYHYGLEL